MENNNPQKIKLLILYRKLLTCTDEMHPLTTEELCGFLAENNITCDRKTLSKDIDMLNSFGYEVMSKYVGHSKGYYIDDRRFSVPELKILIDAVQAADFIPEVKSECLISRIADLGGVHTAERLKKSLSRFNVKKHTNEYIFYNIDRLSDAISSEKRVSFYYFDLDEHARKVYRRNKQLYNTEPLSLVFCADNYYVICYDPDTDGNFKIFRIDKMENVEILEKNISAEAKIELLGDEIGKYPEQAFKMFYGRLERVRLEFDDSLIGVMFDKFGEDILMFRTPENVLYSDVELRVSPVFFGWICQFGGKLRITSPASVKEEFENHMSWIKGN